MLVNSIVFWIFFAVFLLPYFTLIWGRKKILSSIIDQVSSKPPVLVNIILSEWNITINKIYI